MSSLLDINPRKFLSALGRRPLWVGHQLVGHPLLSLDALGALADSMSARPDRAPEDRPGPGPSRWREPPRGSGVVR